MSSGGGASIIRQAKKPRLVANSGSEAPDGYHYEDEQATFFNGKITKRLRRNIVPAPSREVMYRDLYCGMTTAASTEGGKDLLVFHCCTCSEAIPMYYKENGTVVFSNFFQHLQNRHEELLIEADRTLEVPVAAQPVAEQQTGMRSFLTGRQPQPQPVVAAAAASSTAIPRAESRYNAHTDNLLREKITAAVVKVIAHGPYPISFLQNPAVAEFLVQLGVIRQDFKLHHRKTVTKRLDEFLNAENEKQMSSLIEAVDMVSLSWDEWTSKSNDNYMSVNVCCILPDFSCMIESIIAMSLFEYPHEMKDIRKKVIEMAQRLFPSVPIPDDAEESREEGALVEAFLKTVKSLTYDGAAANYAFSPDPDVSSLSCIEKTDRTAICSRYMTVEERRCLCHRLIKYLEHCLNDESSRASAKYQKVFDDMYGFFSLISKSQKNLQELKRVQEIDVDRIGNVIVDIRAPESR